MLFKLDYFHHHVLRVKKKNRMFIFLVFLFIYDLKNYFTFKV